MSSKTGNSFALWRQLYGKSATPNVNLRHDQNKFPGGQSTNYFEQGDNYIYGTQVKQLSSTTESLLRPFGFEDLSKHDILRYERGECLSGVFASRKRVPSRDCFNNARYRWRAQYAGYKWVFFVFTSIIIIFSA